MASEHSGKGVNYNNLYRQTVINWLEKVWRFRRNPIIRNPNQYINHIKSLTNNNSNSKMTRNLKLLSRNENLGRLSQSGIA